MVLVLLLVILTLYAAFSGFKDSILYGRLGADSFSFNEHILFNLERTTVLAAVLVSTQLPMLAVLCASISFIFMFSMVHNSAYYYGRSLLDKKPFDITYSSTSSTAKLEFNFVKRLIMFIIGIILVIAFLVFS